MTPDAPAPYGAPQPPWPQYAPPTPPAPPPRRLPSRRRIWLIGITTAVVASGLGALGTVSSAQARSDPRSARNERALIAACHEQVAQLLKSPLSARWMRDDAAGADESGVWHVTGGVHAANGFGVLLPHRFQCAADWRRDHTWLVYDTTVTTR